MITLLLAGGLGNQMFQYAFARCLALRNGDKLQMSRYYCTPRVSRPYALNNLNLSEDVSLMSKFQEFIAVTKFRVVNKLCKFLIGKQDYCSKRFVIQLDSPDNYESKFMTLAQGGGIALCADTFKLGNILLITKKKLRLNFQSQRLRVSRTRQ